MESDLATDRTRGMMRDLFGTGDIIGMDPRAMGRALSVRKPSATRLVRVLGWRVTDYLGHKAGKRVAIVDIMGPLMQRATETWWATFDGYDDVSKRVIAALEDRANDAVLLRIDSPGGYVAGCEEAIRAIVAVRDRVKKPLAVYVDELAASAAYWLAAGVADAGIYVPASGEVGSIGVYTLLSDERGRYEKDGTAVQIVREPAGKDAANPADPVMDVALSRERERVREVAQRFYEAVAAARGLSVDAVRALDGDILSASRALEAGLADGVCALNDALTAAFAAPNKEREKMAKSKRMSRRAEDTQPAEPEPTPAERATAADVSAAATACAAACTECAAACDGGTADEAIAAVGAMLDACAQAIAIGQSFLGEPAAEEVIEEITEEQDEEVTPMGARVIRLLESIERDRARERREAARRADAEERARLIAGRKMSVEIREWLADPRTPIAEVRAACRALPESYDGYLAADTTVSATQGPRTSIPERVRAKCKRLGIDPEDYMATKRAIAERSGR